ncbi:hypothetical protein [Methylobacterium sp. WSM2598]|uniref:hypothetical protein n=1 Tax=Methylobacterium sp. WSM2598 TaxID=398261 RepID=UPI0003A9FA3B|nr:hypothetical protein [Methylobacterium sp. WSM2598]
MNNRGAIYCAYGARYVESCIESAKSLRATNPDLGIAIFTDAVDETKKNFSDIFDHVCPLIESESDSEYLAYLKSEGKLPSLKVMICDRSPFDYTLSIDGDTLVIGDLSHAFDRLDDYDFLAMAECENGVEQVNGNWAATSLIDTRRRGYVNAGVILFRSDKPGVAAFLRGWRERLRDGGAVPPELCTNDQDLLNFMLYHPELIGRDFTFSDAALNAEQYNCYCRMWKEVWECGGWPDVRIVHSWLTSWLAALMRDPAFEWGQIFRETAAHAHYISQFSIGDGAIPAETKSSVYRSDPLQRVSVRTQMLNAARLINPPAGVTRADAVSTIMDAGFSSLEGEPPCARLLDSLASRWSSPTIVKFGIRHLYPGLPGFRPGRAFRTGFDLEFLSEVFPGSTVTAVTRDQAVRHKRASISTVHADGEPGASLRGRLPASVELMIDDQSADLAVRLATLVDALPLLAADGVALMIGIAGSDHRQIVDALAERLGGSETAWQVEPYVDPAYSREPIAIVITRSGGGMAA